MPKSEICPIMIGEQMCPYVDLATEDQKGCARRSLAMNRLVRDFKFHLIMKLLRK